MFAGFETSFTTFAVLFLALWKLVSIDRMYRCQDTFLNVHSQALKQVLQHLKFYFESIGGIVAKIYGKKGVFAGFETCFSAFAVLYLALLRLF